MGDISAYLADHHREKFFADNGQVDLGLFNVFAKVNGYKADKRSPCEQRATHSYEILRELLGEKPNYREVQLVLLYVWLNEIHRTARRIKFFCGLTGLTLLI